MKAQRRSQSGTHKAENLTGERKKSAFQLQRIFQHTFRNGEYICMHVKIGIFCTEIPITYFALLHLTFSCVNLRSQVHIKIVKLIQ